MEKADAYDSVLKFLDEQKPRHVQEFKDKMKMADSFTLSGVAKIVDARSKLGIDVAKQ
jgi:hypothetical protein